MSDGVVIVAMAAQSALGRSLREAVHAVRADTIGIREPISLEQRPATSKGVGESPLPGSARSDRYRAERLLRDTADALMASLPDGALAGDPSRNMVVIGTTVGGMRHCGAAIRLQDAGHEDAALSAFAAVPASAVLRRAFRGLPVDGASITVSCACASALSAIAHGTALLQIGDADAVVVGGYDPVSEFVYGGFGALQLIADGPLQPFAKDRGGMKLGEGCVLFVLRRASDAAKAGIPVIASIESIGESSDAHHLTQPHPDGAGAAAALRQAVSGEGPDLLLAHATGTPGNDGAEYAAYRSAFGDRLAGIRVVAMKGRLGHPLGAAGAMELAIALECAKEGLLPTGAGPEPDRDAFPDLNLVRGAARSIPVRRITALAAGFGGANVAVTVAAGGPARGRAVAVPPRVVSVAGWGSVSPGGRGLDGLRLLETGAPGPVPEAVLSSLVDRARFRRIAMLPRLVLAAMADLRDSGAITSDELEQTPVLCATWHGAADFTERYYRDLVASGVDLANPLLFAESVPNIASGHASIGFGITAACASVIGSRNAGFEALALASARIRAGTWDRAVVIAAEEEHPLIDAVLSRWSGAEVRSRSSAVAMLLRAMPDGSAGGSLVVGPATAVDVGRCSQSPLDATMLLGRPGVTRTGVPEMGAVTGPAVAMLAAGSDGGRVQGVWSAEPGGASWLLRIEDPQGRRGSVA